jgi:CheY-like chemotaxis protein
MIDVHVGETAESPDFPWATLIGIIPHLIWATLLVWFLLRIGRDGLQGLLARIHKVGVAGVELEFKEALQQAVNQRGQTIPALDLGRASRRLSRETALINGARILWVDDAPANNQIETQLFEAAGARVDSLTSNVEAMAAVDRIIYDLVISDIARPDEGKAGLTLADALVVLPSAPAVILYVGQAKKPVPASAFAVTDRPDELVHFVLDALARRRG